jgi:hypothetical protein
MPILRTMRRKLTLAGGWLVVSGFAVFLVVSLCQLYWAWATRTVYLPHSWSEWRAAFEARTILFFVEIAFWSLCCLVSAACIAMAFVGEMAERRFARIRKTTPPLDTAIHEPFDRRGAD